MTEISSAATSLLSGVEASVTQVRGVELYLFGSSTHDNTSPMDVDVLILYSDGDLSRGHDVAETIRGLPVAGIYDVLALSESEERELKFIDSECAIRIWPTAG